MSNITETLTLTEFLLARIGEDEATAHAVQQESYGEGRWRWDLHRGRPYRSALVDERGVVVLPPANDDVYPSASVAEHIAHHDPARVLAECEAKRRMVEWINAWQADVRDEGLQLLALPHADHPDYRDEWRP